jgi:TonB family protein
MLTQSIAFFLALASAAVQPGPEPRAPAAKWNVNFADAQCIAHRDYGRPGSPLKLILKAAPVGDVMQVALLRPAPWTAAEQVDATVTVDGGPPVKTSLLMYSPKESKDRVYLLNMPSADFASVRQAKTLSVRSSGMNETFQLSQMEPLLKVVDECVADLRRVFNIPEGGAEATGFKSRAKTNLAKFFSDTDYPSVAVMKGQSGKVRFALLISEDGRVADCTIVATSGVPSLDSQACALLKARAKFQPALGLDGKPAKDSVVGNIVWRMAD